MKPKSYKLVSSAGETFSHLRRCHVCGEVTESLLKPVSRCEHCGKPMAPFFYFDERGAVVLADGILRPPDLPNQYRAIQGLTAYWEEG